MVLLKKSAIVWNLIALVICVGILFWLWPELLHRWVYAYGLLKWPIAIPLCIAGYFIFKNFKTDEKITSRLATTSTALSLLATVIGGIVYTFIGYHTYNQYTVFAKREHHVVSDPMKYRFTPERVAFRNMNDSVNDAAEHIEPDWTGPIIMHNGYAYGAPITPEGIEPTFRNSVTGIMVYEDRPGNVADEKRRHRIEQIFKVGPGMQWFDALERKLVLNDFFTIYDDLHLLAWDPSKPEEFVIAVPKTKYSWFLFPYWAGVTIVHADGTLEDFTPEEIQTHPLLKNQWVYPKSLAKYYIQLQNFGTKMGLLSPYFQVSGKLELYTMESVEPDSDSSASNMETRQPPFLTAGADGYPYLVAMVKAQGGGSGVYRAYYINAASGEGTYVEYTKGSVHYGPVASLTRVKKVPGYNWRREAGGSVSGNIIVEEPTYIVRAKDPDILYWKGSILATNYAAISATVVAPAADPENFMLFRNRPAFDAWLAGDDSAASSRDEILMKMQGLMSDLGKATLSAEEIQTLLEQAQIKN
jgi:hypothetical protein